MRGETVKHVAKLLNFAHLIYVVSLAVMNYYIIRTHNGMAPIKILVFHLRFGLPCLLLYGFLWPKSLRVFNSYGTL
jgi:hypothetical protein